jgi:C4-dicarboxylate-specific signal transduction histidine kinase
MANVDHIKTIVSTQQTYAGVSGVIQSTDVNALLDDAIRMDSSSFERHEVTVIRDYAALPPILVDKQRVLQIVINLVKNAKEALMEQREKQRVLTLRTRVENDRLVIQVSDTGAGIKSENLTQMFTHGFTTKKTGHGFGLHSCANAATEMNGCLTVHSDGDMAGATFTLSLPLSPAMVGA